MKDNARRFTPFLKKIKKTPIFFYVSMDVCPQMDTLDRKIRPFGFVETLLGHKKEEGNTKTGGGFTPSLPHPH